MKRFALLLTATLLLSIFISAPLLASPPRIESRFSSFHLLVSRCIIYFIGPFHGYVALPPIEGDGNGGALRGDADDYANGRDGKEGEPAEGDEKRNGRLNAGPAVIGPEGLRPVYRTLYGK